jgi:hypothetical protein
MYHGFLGRPTGCLDMADIRVIVADQTLRSVRDTVRLQAFRLKGNAAHRNLIVVNRSGEGGRYAMTLDDMGKVNPASEYRNPIST